MSDSKLQGSDLAKNLAIFSVIGAIVGAVFGGLEFSSAGVKVNVQAGIVGLIVGAAVLALVTLFTTVTATKAPWIFQLLGGAWGGWLFAGLIWEAKFERQMDAQLVGLVIGMLVMLLNLNRERLEKTIRGQSTTSKSRGPVDKPPP